MRLRGIGIVAAVLTAAACGLNISGVAPPVGELDGAAREAGSDGRATVVDGPDGATVTPTLDARADARLEQDASVADASDAVDGDADADGATIPLTCTSSSCPSPGVCTGGKCTFICTSATSCPNITCPPDVPCAFVCNGDGCTKISCGFASSCDVTCNDNRACDGVVCAGPGTCNINCAANNACDNVTCTGPGILECPFPNSCNIRTVNTLQCKCSGSCPP